MVAAEQLKAAHGNVRCGTCLESFDAIPHLSDGPLQAPPAAPVKDDAGADVALEDQLEAADVDAADPRSAGAKLSSTLSAARAAASHDTAVTSVPGPGPDIEGRRPANAGDNDGRDDIEAVDDDPAPDTAAPASPSTGGQRRVAVLDHSPQGGDAPLPDVLRADAEAFAAQSAARRRNLGYGISALALLALLAGQYVFFMPEDAARRYPQFRGAIESVCVHVGCVLSERRDPSRIRVLSRDVRVHPRYEGVMQIKATLTNAAPFRQPYPQFQFTLFNVNGQTIASRVFQPSEYLGRPVAASARLRPKTPFQVELDVLAPAEAAVSFEFQFL